MVKIKQQSNIDLVRILHRTSAVRVITMEAASLSIGKNKKWMSGVCARNRATEKTIADCARAFGITTDELLTICDR